MTTEFDYPETIITEVVNHALRLRALNIEQACEQALQGGLHGVMVHGLTAWVDPHVPYGNIWYVDEWRMLV